MKNDYMDTDIYIYMCTHGNTNLHTWKHKFTHIQTHGNTHAQNMPSPISYASKTFD